MRGKARAEAGRLVPLELPGWDMRFKDLVRFVGRAALELGYAEDGKEEQEDTESSPDEADLGAQVGVRRVEQVW